MSATNVLIILALAVGIGYLPKRFSTRIMMNTKLNEKHLAFWKAESAQLPWFKQTEQTLEWNEPFAHWFAGGMLNASYICLDHHVKNGRGHHKALLWKSKRVNIKSLPIKNYMKR